MSVANFMQLVLMDGTLWTKALNISQTKRFEAICKCYANATQYTTWKMYDLCKISLSFGPSVAFEYC